MNLNEFIKNIVVPLMPILVQLIHFTGQLILYWISRPKGHRKRRKPPRTKGKRDKMDKTPAQQASCHRSH